MSRDLETSRSETQAAKLSTEGVAAEKGRSEERLTQHLEEHSRLTEVSAQNAMLDSEHV